MYTHRYFFFLVFLKLNEIKSKILSKMIKEVNLMIPEPLE